jgi:hypothetical protein
MVWMSENPDVSSLIGIFQVVLSMTARQGQSLRDLQSEGIKSA